jgi:hypothetical protein
LGVREQKVAIVIIIIVVDDEMGAVGNVYITYSANLKRRELGEA